MLTIEVEWLHGTVRAAGEDVALTGQPSRGEWPPSPARLYSALVAADGTRDRCRVTDGSELRVLESQPAPLIHADSSEDAPESVVLDRFVVLNESTRGAVQEYPARANSVARPGCRRSPRHPVVAYVWPDAEIDQGTLEALRRRAARIGYVGCADSPARVRVLDGPPGEAVPKEVWTPDPSGDVLLPVPFAGFVDVLDGAFDQFAVGETRRAWFRSEPATYRGPGSGVTPYRVPGSFVWLRFAAPVDGRHVLRVTETLRKAVLDLYQRKVVGPGGEVPSVLTGHGFTGRGFRHALWLALPDVGHRYARGRIHGAAIGLPDDTPNDVLAGVRKAVWHLRKLVCPKVFGVEVRPYGGETSPAAASPRRWQRPATRFASVFPVVHERFVRPKPSLEEVARWCAHADLPPPVGLRQRREPWLPGAPSLHPGQMFRPSDERRPSSHMELVFERPIIGPVLLGRKRPFGLGLFLPRSEAKDSADE